MRKSRSSKNSGRVLSTSTKSRRKNRAESTNDQRRHSQSFGPTRIIITYPSVAAPQERKHSPKSEQGDNEPKNKIVQTVEPFLPIVRKMIKQIEPIARRMGVIAEAECLPEDIAVELTEKIKRGLCHWAVRKLSRKIEKYLEEGRINFMNDFDLILLNPYRPSASRRNELFHEAIDGAEFFIPLTPSKKTLRDEDWQAIWSTYCETFEGAQLLWKQTFNDRAERQKQLKTLLRGIRDEELAKLKRPFQVALEITRRKHHLRRVKAETLRKYLRPFQREIPRYGYFDFLLKNMTPRK